MTSTRRIVSFLALAVNIRRIRVNDAVVVSSDGRLAARGTHDVQRDHVKVFGRAIVIGASEQLFKLKLSYGEEETAYVNQCSPLSRS